MQEPEQTGPRVNDRIRAPRVLVIDETGTKLGEFMTEDAIALAHERGVDLIEVAPNGRPPVCRIGDFGRIKYEKQKKDAAARKRQTVVSTKEVKLRPKTDEHDYQVKLRHARRFLEAGDKVKVTVRFRGREMAHRNIGEQRCRELAGDCEDLAIIETLPNMEGRQMFMIIAPKKK
ncbi:MAG: translation initiation factor IF-3 [Oligoflexia bacterium]|nr:translation initiation factor IF-3 [Oligoflexia bacterium]